MIRISGRHGETEIKDQYSTYNGQKITWFLGDWNNLYNHWECWGSCNGKMYQLCGVLKKDSTDLENINVCNKSGDHYFDQEIHNLLSLPFQQSEETKKVH